MARKPPALDSQTVDVGHSFRQSASTPSLPSALGRTMRDRPMQASNSMSTLNFGRHTIGTSSAWAEKMKSPGRHKYSSVPMEYPGLDPTLRPASSHFCPHIFYPKPKTPKLVPGARKKALPSGRNEADLARVAAEKSVRMRDALFNLRRAGKPEKSETPSHSPEPVPKKSKKKQKKEAKVATAVKDVPQTCEFSYTWEQQQGGMTFQQKAEEELKNRGVSVEDLGRRISIVDSLGIQLELDGAAALFEKRFPIQVTLLVSKLPALPGEEASDEEEAEEQEAEEKTEKSHLEEKETTIMIGCLGGVRDTHAETLLILQGLQELQDPVLEAGGSRHATAIVAARTLLVVRRKAELLARVEERKALFDTLIEQKQKILEDVTANTSPCPDGLLGIRQFVARLANKPEENPADADKSNFEHFANNFGMHRKHMYFEEMLESAKVLIKWWSKETMRLAVEGAESDVIKRNIDVVNGIGAAKEAYDEIADDMKETVEIMGDMLALRCLEFARKMKEQDAEVVKRSKDAQPQSAKEKALAINNEIRRAVSLGAPAKHQMLSEAKGIATYLEAEEKDRYGYRAFLAAQKIQQKDENDAMVYEKKEGVPPVGPASHSADMVEKEIKEALKLGAPATSDHIANTTKISKDLRDADGNRKRTAARAKRLMEAAAKSAD